MKRAGRQRQPSRDTFKNPTRGGYSFHSFFKVVSPTGGSLRECTLAIRLRTSSVYLAKLTGVFPEGMEHPRGIHEPTETRQFDDPDDAREWLFGVGLQSFAWPIAHVELFSTDGTLLWKETHHSNPLLQDKNAHWWRKARPRQATQKTAYQPMNLVRVTDPQQHPEASHTRQVIVAYPDLKTRMGWVTRSADGSWTIELAGRRWRFESEESCKFFLMGFGEGTGMPTRIQTLSSFLIVYAPEEHYEAFRCGRELGGTFVKRDQNAEPQESADRENAGGLASFEGESAHRTSVEVHANVDGVRGALVFEIEGGKEGIDDVMQAANYFITRAAKSAGVTPLHFVSRALRELPQAANQKRDDPNRQQVMQLSAMYLVGLSPQFTQDRTIRNCSVVIHENEAPKVHIAYLS
jgi:hypothetical protein